jgi:hypothetical protein
VNLRKSKTLNDKSISELWQQGKQKEVIKYNENDCMLTKALWWHLVNKRSIRIAYYDKYEQRQIDKSFDVSIQNIAYLTGKNSLFTFPIWVQKIKKDGYILKKEPRKYYREDEDIEWEPEAESMYHWFYCDQCSKTFLFESKIQRGFADYEMVKCPKCEKQFGEIRADLGCISIGEKRGYFGSGSCQGLVPDPFRDVVLAHIESTRREWELHPILKQILYYRGKRCGICARDLTDSDELYANPADDSPICVECLTAGRWLLSLK